ncbi:hypothetical protein GCM10023340_04850 [Nocardioides marinquilinus]|uniref:SGNH hydrolase-type esterase domain-containing protein n=1 Tax=Nocardioides marinquilinus TaxID=1210400 RepID=A0ABP9P7Q4_9ACTN
MPVRPRGVLAALAVPALVATALTASPPAQAAAEQYVALGDSYSSGVGTRSYLDDGTSCKRSPAAYPSLIAAQNGWSLDLRACSGATIPDVEGQLAALTASTTKVTVSVGGNDAGFADVLTECAQPGWMSDCDEAVDGAQAFISGTLPGRLAGLYSDIGAGAPSADVVVVGYPRVFMGEDCNAATFFSPEEEARLNATADQLNGVLASAASNAGFAFANPTNAFIGHAVCDDPEWINGLSNPIDESYHPNTAGHSSGYAPLVGSLLGGARTAPTAADAATARADADEQVDKQREWRAFDRTIEPTTFRLVAPAAR